MTTKQNDQRVEEQFHRRELAGFVKIVSGEIGVLDPKYFDGKCHEKSVRIRRSVSEYFMENFGASVPEIHTRLGSNPVFVRRNNRGDASRIMVDFRETAESIALAHRSAPLVRYMETDDYLVSVRPPTSRFLLIVDPVIAEWKWNNKRKNRLDQVMDDHEFRDGVVKSLGGIIVRVQSMVEDAQIRRCYDRFGNETGIEFSLDEPEVWDSTIPWMSESDEP